jgi:enediyne biosynthesis protein E5
MIVVDSWNQKHRLAGLRRFAIAITFLNFLGHTVLGFEQSWAQPFVALGSAYSVELLLECADAWVNQRQLSFVGGIQKLVNFLLPAHITALAIGMLLYANDQLLPITFAVAVAIGSKAVFKAPVGSSYRHFLNPSNFGITVTLLLFPQVGIAPPYQFTENLSGVADWILPGLIICSGTFLNFRFTKRLPLIVSWLSCFMLQAFLRSWVFGTPLIAGLVPMTGVAFVLFTFYMVTDPGTTPSSRWNQVLFGGGMAGAYGLLMTSHVVFGLFFGLTIVCIVRGISLYLPVSTNFRVASMSSPMTISLEEV